MRKARGYLLVLVGLVAIGAAIAAFLESGVSLGSKYGAYGRDSGGRILLLLIGIGACAGGVIDVLLAAEQAGKPRGVGADEKA